MALGMQNIFRPLKLSKAAFIKPALLSLSHVLMLLTQP